jgi:hypothetical protein
MVGREGGEGMADEFGVDAAGAVEGASKGKMTSMRSTRALHPAQAAALPGPELRADEPEDRDAEALAVHGEAEVDVGEVDEDGERGAVAAEAATSARYCASDVGRGGGLR